MKSPVSKVCYRILLVDEYLLKYLGGCLTVLSGASNSDSVSNTCMIMKMLKELCTWFKKKTVLDLHHYFSSKLQKII